jgi:hypothetical protein
MVRLASVVLMLSLALGPGSPAEDPDLAAGIGLVNDGDFEGAVLRLDTAARRLETVEGSQSALAQAYLYLGICYLELDQELVARGKFREALRQDPALRLAARLFSPQVIRVFEATRQEAGLKAAPPLPDVPAKLPATTLPPEPKKKRSAVPILLIAGGGAAAAGIAVASGGGGGASTPTTTLAASTTTTTTAATTTTTQPPTSTTLPGTSCSFTITPASVSLPKDGGTGTCQVRPSRSSCRWTAESAESWLHITGGASGTGTGTVRFLADKNDGKAREGRIRLREARSAQCLVLQAADTFQAAEESVSVASELLLAGGEGQMVLNGLSAWFEGTGRRELVARARRGENRIEATVAFATSAPGTWRLDLHGAIRPGSLRVLAGEVLSITPESVVFRVQGRAGERLVLLFHSGP